MADGRRSEAWEHTAWLSALIANCNRDQKKRPRPYKPADFNPMRRRAEKKPTVGAIREMRALFEKFPKRKKRKEQP